MRKFVVVICVTLFGLACLSGPKPQSLESRVADMCAAINDCFPDSAVDCNRNVLLGLQNDTEENRKAVVNAHEKCKAAKSCELLICMGEHL